MSNKPTIESVTQLRLSLLRNGFKPIELLTGTKIPKRKKWNKEHHWKEGDAVTDDALNTGLVTDGLVVPDDDVDDKARSQAIEARMIKTLGKPALTRRRTGSNRFASLYLPEDGYEHRKLVQTGTEKNLNDKLEKVELLGIGQQLFCFGEHPEGGELEWDDGADPSNTARSVLPQVSEEAIHAFLDGVASIFSVKPSYHRRRQAQQLDSELKPEAPIEDIRAALGVIGNRGADRPEWIRVGYATHGASGGSEEGEQAWTDWSLLHPSVDEGEEGFMDEEYACRIAWAGMDRGPGVHSGFGVLYNMAKEVDPDWMPPSHIAQRKNISTWNDGEGIVWQEGKMNAIIDHVEYKLVEDEAEIFVRGMNLVTPKRVKSDDGSEGIVLLPMTIAWMTTILNRDFQWKCFLKGKDKETGEPKEKLIRAPEVIIKPMLAPNRSWKYRQISGIVTCPTLRPDGSLLYKPGWDRPTKLWHVGDPAFRGIEERFIKDPSEEDVLAALGRIKKRILPEVAFSGYGTDDEGGGKAVSVATALSMFLTPAARGMLGRVPWHCVNGPTPGTGKSYLIFLVGCLILGHAVPALAVSSRKEELDTSVTAHIRQAHPLLNMDNVPWEVRSSLLNQLVSEILVEVRPFNQNETTELVPYRGTPYINGNNLTITEDMIRRSVMCHLDSRMEHPEKKKYKTKPHEYILANRCEVLIDCLTIVLGHKHAGKLTQLAGFGEWSDYVRSPINFYHGADCVVSQEWMTESDPDRSMVNEVMGVMKKDYGSGVEFTVQEWIDEADDTVGAGSHGELFNALLMVCKMKDKRPSASDCGSWLRYHKNRPFDGMMFVQVRKKHQAVVWGFCEVGRRPKDGEWLTLAVGRERQAKLADAEQKKMEAEEDARNKALDAEAELKKRAMGG